jgi:hypothetical protein
VIFERFGALAMDLLNVEASAEQHHLAAVPVAERAQIEHRARQAQRVAHGDQVRCWSGRR